VIQSIYVGATTRLKEKKKSWEAGQREFDREGSQGEYRSRRGSGGGCFLREGSFGRRLIYALWNRWLGGY